MSGMAEGRAARALGKMEALRLLWQLRAALWTELLAAPIPRNITAARRDLQRVHIDALTALRSYQIGQE